MAGSPQTLLQMQGVPLDPAPLSDSCLVIIDMQEEYRTGALPLPGIEAAITSSRRALELARAKNIPIFHVLHEIPGDAPLFNRAKPGFAEVAELARAPGEIRLVKHFPNAFNGTTLEQDLAQTARGHLIVVGAMTHMCVSATVRAAFDRGMKTTVVANACATRDLPAVDGSVLSAAAVHLAALTELADVFTIVVPDTEGLE